MAAAASNSSSAAAVSLKDYLKRYESSAGADDQKKKKKKKSKPKPVAGGVLVVDEDPVWQKPVQLEEDESNSSGDEKPLVDEDIEVKCMKRLEAIRSRKPYHAISEDGSGWISISDSSKQHSSSASADLDLSPPRQRRARLDTPSPGRERESVGAADEDLSPPRHQKRLGTPSPGRKQRRADTEDRNQSPQRPSRRRYGMPSPEPGGDLSPPMRHQRGSPSDLAPPRRNHQNYHRSQDARDLSPPRRSRKGSSSDLSPPRQHRSPETLGDSPADDLSPPRRSGKGSSGDLSPPRWPHLPEALGTKVPPAAGLSPPSKRRKEEGKTGLLSAKEIRDENAKKMKAQQSRFKSMDPSLTGRGAEPVFRDKEGKPISKEDILKAQEEEKPKERKLEWGKGLAQKREAEAVSRELELERDKPFARTRDDPELDKMLKERIRWGDPMAHLVKRKQSEILLEDLGDNEKMKESGFIIPQTIPSHSWIKRGLDFPPNRYGIRPGRHWDGVDRSSGYEKELFKRKNEKRATETEAYLWSVSDM